MDAEWCKDDRKLRLVYRKAQRARRLQFETDVELLLSIVITQIPAHLCKLGATIFKLDTDT